MKFVLLIDSTYSSNEFIEKIKHKISSVAEECAHVTLHTYILHEGQALDTDTSLLLKILSSEPERTPVIMDAKTAKYFPEIVKLQSSIVVFAHEDNLTLDIDECHPYNAKIAISHGGRIDYLNKDYHDKENDKQLNVVQIHKYIATHEYYVYLAKVFFHEHNHFPLLLLPRHVQLKCTSKEELLKEFNNRNFYQDKTNWVTTEHGLEYNEEEILSLCQDIAIHHLNDERLSKHNEAKNIIFKKV